MVTQTRVMPEFDLLHFVPESHGPLIVEKATGYNQSCASVLTGNHRTERPTGNQERGQVQYPGLWSAEESYLAHTGTYSEHKVLHKSLGISSGVLLQSQHRVTKGRRIASSRTTQAA